MVLTAVGLIGM
jgi:hypothetical protein